MATAQRLIAALLLLATAAAAQAPDDMIVVTGRKAAERREQALAYVRQVSAPPVDGQLARWNTPVCPVVKGIPLNVAYRLEARIRDIARRAGANVADGRCDPNIYVTFAADARRLLADKERRETRLLISMPMAERRALRTSEAPVLWFYGTQTRGPNGDELQGVPNLSALGATGLGGAILPGDDRQRYGDSYNSSLVDTKLRVDISAAVVLVDVPRTTGYRLDAVIDYAAFVALARTRLVPPDGGGPTILSLFARPPGAGPEELTAQDRAYLAALYRVPVNRTARTQSRQLVGAVAQAIPAGD